MGLTSSDLFEELMYEAHIMGIVDELREAVSLMEKPKNVSITSLLPLYESAFYEIKRKRLDN